MAAADQRAFRNDQAVPDVRTYVRENYGSRYYGKAINIVRRLRAAYDVLAKYELLLMPTTPMKATPSPQARR